MNDPIDAEESIEIRKRLLQSAGVDPTGRPMAVPDPDDGEVVSYAVGVGQDGRLRQTFNVAQNARDVARAHRRADEVAAALEDGDSVGTTGSGWETLESGEVTNYSDPYGDLVDYYDMLQSDDTGRAYTFKDRFAQFPGTQEYGSAWENHVGHHKEQWSESNAVTDLHDWEPFGGSDGTVSTTAEVSASITDIGVSYSYTYSTSETYVTDRTSDRNNYAAFDVEYYETSRTSTSGFEPASLGERVEEDYLGSELLDVTSDATFEYFGATETISNNFGFTFPV